MAFHNTVLSQLLKMLPRHEFEKLANAHDGRRRSDALSRWSQFVALSVGHLVDVPVCGDIAATLHTQPQQGYGLGSPSISRSALGRANERLTTDSVSVIVRNAVCALHLPCSPAWFQVQGKAVFAGWFADRSVNEVVSWADYNRKKAAFKLHVGLDHDGLIRPSPRSPQARQRR